MDHLDWVSFRDGDGYAENVPLKYLADKFGTPLYVYSRNAIKYSYMRYVSAFGDDCFFKICFAVKANSNLAILHLLSKMGAGFDIVSVGELEKVLLAGANPSDVVFSGVGKQYNEIYKAVDLGIGCFNVESFNELLKIIEVANLLGRKVNISIRVNPGVDAKTHPYISTSLKESKFGVNLKDAKLLYQESVKHSCLNVEGVDYHIGSQITDLEPFSQALDCVIDFIKDLIKDGIKVKHINIGGGFAVPYNKVDQIIYLHQYINLVKQKLSDAKLSFLKIIVEPGRFILGLAGVLLTKVIYIKKNDDRCFFVVDAAMNDFMRPALYQAVHPIEVVSQTSNNLQVGDVVGPVCESSDIFARQTKLAVNEEDYVIIRGAGAYGAVMSSNYNSRNRAAEVMVDNDKYHCIRRRESIRDQVSLDVFSPEQYN